MTSLMHRAGASRARLALCATLSLGGSAAAAADVPAGTILSIRLERTLSSYGSEAGQGVPAVLIAPVVTEAGTVLPLGTALLGRVDDAERVGFGIVKETARLKVTFDSVVLPDGTAYPLAATVVDLDNARESVDEDGAVRGIRATETFQNVLAGLATSAGFIDPMMLAFTASSAHTVFRVPESEIVLPAGTELQLRLDEPLPLTGDFGPVAPALTGSGGSAEALAGLVEHLPFRTATETGGEPSDLTNLVFIGSREAVLSAFDAAGWRQTDARDAQSIYGTLRSVVENQGYREAPMSTLLLDGKEPEFTYAKTLNTFFERHHFRIFGPIGEFDGSPVWTASSTRDSGVGFATASKQFIHLIDENIDHERDKIVYDLILTGCATGVDYLPRPWLPENPSNATGDRLLTDGRIAVVGLNDCTAPVRADQEANSSEGVRERPSPLSRFGRNVFLTLKNDVYRGNFIYQGIMLGRLGFRALFSHGGDDAGARSISLGGEQFSIVSGSAATIEQELEEIDKPAAQAARQSLPTPAQPQFQNLRSAPAGYDNLLEFSVSGIRSNFTHPVFATQNLETTYAFPELNLLAKLTFGMPTRLDDRWAVSGNVTLNSNEHVSHELGYTYTRSVLRANIEHPLIGSMEAAGPAVVRQFNYNVLLHLRPRGARIRPYAAIGPGMQMLGLTDALEGENQLLKFAYKDAALILKTWNFGRTPPLSGGGVFQWTLQYGLGIKLHLTSRLIVRADVRETLSQAPDVWTESHGELQGLADDPTDSIESIEPLPVILHGPLRHQRYSVGVGIGF